ncbi:MAG: hypothetical protein IJZ64_00820 [Ruminococcus sp.]|nr:hypothetical protein [Ruminococcus sp.]
MKKMSAVSMREANGGCQHWSIALIKRTTIGRKSYYTWLCGKCGKYYKTTLTR